MSDIRNMNGKRAALSLKVCSRTFLTLLVWLAIVSAASAQKVPQNGEELAIGTDVMAPCSCEGNLCSLWPPPASGTFPKGFNTAQTKITSFISRGVTIEGHWEADKGVGGAAVTEPSKGGRCVKVNGAGVQTGEAAPAILSMTSPGTYRLSIVKFEWKATYDCRQADRTFSNPHVLQSEMSTEERFYAVVPNGAPAVDQHVLAVEFAAEDGKAVDLAGALRFVEELRRPEAVGLQVAGRVIDED